jgi:hypothetical protein
LTTADRALLRALASWGGPDGDRFWDLLPDPRREAFRSAWEQEAGRWPSAAARRELRREHEAQARPDPGRIHPTWWIRALQDESPAVRRVVVAHAPTPNREAVRGGLHLADADLADDGRAHPEALQWALSLWSERLVGDLPERPDDPSVIRAITQPDREFVRRLVDTAGLAKRAYAVADGAEPDEDEETPDDPEGRARLEAFRASWGPPDPALVRVARQDLRVAAPAGLEWPALGLTTIGRLLAVVDSYRVRWAIQHLPYAVAKFTRSRMSLKHPLVSAQALVTWEGRALRLAWDRLREEADESGASP